MADDNPRLRPVKGGGKDDNPGGSGRSAEDVLRFVDAYLQALPSGGDGWRDALDGFTTLIARWRDADVAADPELPVLLDAASRLAADRGMPAGELLSGVARLARREDEAPRAATATHERVLEAAYAVFAEKGFYSATADEIADRAGVGKGTIYRHFESKENLFRAVVQDRLDVLTNRVRDAFLDSDDVLAAIRRAVLRYLRFFEEHREFYRILVYEQQSFGTEFRASYIAGILEQVPIIRELVIEASEGGRLKPLDDFYTVFYGLVGFVDGVIAKWYRNDCQGNLSDELDVIIEVLFYGFVKNGAALGRGGAARGSAGD